MLLEDVVAELTATGPARLSLPEYRQVELYTKRKTLAFAPPAAEAGPPMAALAGLVRAFLVLDAWCETRVDGFDRMPSWQRYLALPRATRTDKMVAELYRMLRIARIVLFHPQGHADMDEGVIKINGAINKVALSLELTVIGARLLESAVAYVLGAQRQPYPPAYVEAMLGQYFHDIVAEVKRFADEDRVLYQFRHPGFFHRHFRFDCDNPKYSEADGFLHIEIGALHRDRALYPIDFYAVIGDVLHIIPVEALTDGRIALADLAKWRARLADGTTLPAGFRHRFGREVMVVGQPMT